MIHCPDCNQKLTKKHGTIKHKADILGTIEVPDIDYEECSACKSQWYSKATSVAIFKAVQAKTKGNVVMTPLTQEITAYRKTSKMIVPLKGHNHEWMADVKVTELIDEDYVKRAAAYSTQDPTILPQAPMDTWYASEHSPIRLNMFFVELRGIPNYVCGHLVRHHVGVTPFMQTSRPDRKGPYDTSRYDAKNLALCINAQSLIDMSKKRLCKQADVVTLQVMTAVKTLIESINPDLARHMMPTCDYRGGKCYEFKSCGYKPHFKAVMVHATVKPVDGKKEHTCACGGKCIRPMVKDDTSGKDVKGDETVNTEALVRFFVSEFKEQYKNHNSKAYKMPSTWWKHRADCAHTCEELHKHGKSIIQYFIWFFYTFYGENRSFNGTKPSIIGAVNNVTTYLALYGKVKIAKK